jgi:predicted lipid-binding transport protein (Tim44 family)
MMPGVMMSGYVLLWMMIGIVLCLVLLATITWLFVRWLNNRRTPSTQHAAQPQDSSYLYEQGYRSEQQTPETYQEGGKQYPYPQKEDEKPRAEYPQEMPFQR